MGVHVQTLTHVDVKVPGHGTGKVWQTGCVVSTLAC